MEFTVLITIESATPKIRDMILISSHVMRLHFVPI